MKFHWFAEVTYPHLPADFKERYKSAWVTPPAHLIDPCKAGEMYRMFIRLMQIVDQERRHHGGRQFAGALQPTDPGRRGVCISRLPFRGQAHGRIRARHPDGLDVRLRDDS